MFAGQQFATSATRARALAPGVVVLGLLSLGIPLQGQRLAGYEWPEDHTEHIVYIGVDTHVHELWLKMGGSWQHNDLIANSCADPKPPAAASTMGPVAAFVWHRDNTEHVIYVGTDFNVHELWLRRASAGGDNCWHHTDLNQVPPAVGTPLADASSGLAAFEWPIDGSEHFFFKGQDGFIHEISKNLVWRGNPWSEIDYSDGPRALGPVTGYINPIGDRKHTVYFDENGSLVDASFQIGQRHPSFNTLPGGPAQGTALATFARPEDDRRSIFTTGDGMVFETHRVGSDPWTYYWLRETLGSPPVPAQLGSVSAYVFPSDSSEHVVYNDLDGRIAEFYHFDNAPDWHYRNLTTNSRGVQGLADPSSGIAGYIWIEDDSQHVVFIGCDQLIHELWKKDGVWHNSTPSLETNAPLAATSGCDNYPRFEARPR